MSQESSQAESQPTVPNAKPRVRFINDLFAFLDKPAYLIDNFLYKVKHIPETNYRIAQEMSDAGHYRDAVWRLQITLWFDATHQPAYYLLGCCFISLKEDEKAKAALLKAIELNPDDEEAIFMLATLDLSLVATEKQPRTMPTGIALGYFSGAAENYEAMQFEAGYKGHQLADSALWEWLDSARSDYRALDLGCGSGLCGSLLAERAEDITGVDFCEPMLMQAELKRRPDGRPIYTSLLHQDLLHFAIDLKSQRFDAVVAAHVFNYVGQIHHIFDGVAEGLRDGGVFVFQVERFAYEDNYGLISGLGRFGHGDIFVRQHLERVGLRLVAADIVPVYPDYEMVQYVAIKA